MFSLTPSCVLLFRTSFTVQSVVTGSFTASLKLYNDASRSTLLSTGDSVTVRDRIYASVTLDHFTNPADSDIIVKVNLLSGRKGHIEKRVQYLGEGALCWWWGCESKRKIFQLITSKAITNWNRENFCFTFNFLWFENNSFIITHLPTMDKTAKISPCVCI